MQNYNRILKKVYIAVLILLIGFSVYATYYLGQKSAEHIDGIEKLALNITEEAVRGPHILDNVLGEYATPNGLDAQVYYYACFHGNIYYVEPDTDSPKISGIYTRTHIVVGIREYNNLYSCSGWESLKATFTKTQTEPADIVNTN